MKIEKLTQFKKQYSSYISLIKEFTDTHKPAIAEQIVRKYISELTQLAAEYKDAASKPF